VFSLFIDRIGYKVAMIFSFVCYLIYSAMAFAAYSTIHGVAPEALHEAQAKGHHLIYLGSIILALGNGSVEAYINPIVTTLFSKDKTKWLNRLHAGWPGGLVIGGLCTIALAGNSDWRITLGIILVPAIVFFLILISLQFPKSEREQAASAMWICSRNSAPSAHSSGLASFLRNWARYSVGRRPSFGL